MASTTERRVATGIYKTPYGWRLYVRVGGRLKAKRVKDHDHELSLATLKAMRDDWRTDVRRAAKLPPTSEPGTFAADIREKYLPARAAMPGIAARRKHLDLWIAEFGDRPRASITSWEIARVRDRWLTIGPKRICIPWDEAHPKPAGCRQGRWIDVATPLSARQVNNRLRALENVYTVLDGRHAPNPVREAGEAAEPDHVPRALAFALIEKVLAEMPDERYGAKLTPASVAAIRKALARRRRDWGRISRLALEYGVSETMIRKIHAGGYGGKNGPGLTKLRIRVFPYTGLSHGELMGITETDLHLDDTPPWVWVAGRLKGKGTKGVAQPLTPEGADALRALAAAGGLGRFSVSSMWRSWARGCAKADVTGTRPYDLRHSHATELLEKTGGNLPVTQLLMRHKDHRTTLRYAAAAVDPVRRAAIDLVTAKGGFKVTPRVTREPNEAVK